MAKTSIQVNRQNVLDFLKTGVEKPFVIPDYQRPYAWTRDQIETLFEDIYEFATTVGGLKRKGNYFLGSIVAFENENGEQEIIDGQQRITSLFLLLRAIYTKLKNSDDANTPAGKNFISIIEPAIWRKDNLTGEVDYTDILLTSRVMDNAGNDILKNILRTGKADPKATDNYSKNYIIFQELYEKKCANTALNIYDFIFALLNQAIVLPIGADTQDTALTIFSTLNDRGMPLSDADIFKAKIYNHLPDQKKPVFIEKWKTLDNDAAETGESIQGLFYYYMFYLRAVEKDINTTTPGMRKFFLTDKCKRLFEPNLMQQLTTMLNLWKVVKSDQMSFDIPEETWDNNPKIRKALDTLMSYPNEFWKYPVITYYLSHKGKEGFDVAFLKFLNKLISELMPRFVLFPSLSAIKPHILKLDRNIIESMRPTFEFPAFDDDMIMELKKRIVIPHRHIVRMLLKCYAYNHQDEVMEGNWQIEHILPRRWQPTFFQDIEADVINELIEHIGNKTPFESKLNIVASNGYFQKKKDEYRKSNIEVTRILVISCDTDWTLDNIRNRDSLIISDIMGLLRQWNEEYC